MLSIPVQPVGAQTLSISLGGQSVQLGIFQTRYGLFMTVQVNNVQIVAWTLCENLNRIVRDLYLGFVGDLVWFDNSGANTDPVYTGLGAQYSLLYLAPSELPAGLG